MLYKTNGDCNNHNDLPLFAYFEQESKTIQNLTFAERYLMNHHQVRASLANVVASAAGLGGDDDR